MNARYTCTRCRGVWSLDELKNSHCPDPHCKGTVLEDTGIENTLIAAKRVTYEQAEETIRRAKREHNRRAEETDAA